MGDEFSIKQKSLSHSGRGFNSYFITETCPTYSCFLPYTSLHLTFQTYVSSWTISFEGPPSTLPSQALPQISVSQIRLPQRSNIQRWYSFGSMFTPCGVQVSLVPVPLGVNAFGA